MPSARKIRTSQRPSARPLLPPSLGMNCSVDGTVSASKKRRLLALRDGGKWASAGWGLVRNGGGGRGWLAAVWHSPGECQNISCGRSCRQRAPKNDLRGPSGPPEHRQEVHPAHAGQGKRGSPGIVGRLEALNHRPDAPRTPKEANISDPPTGQLRTAPPNAWSRGDAGERHLAASASRRRCGRLSRVVGRPATAINGAPLRSHSKRQ